MLKKVFSLALALSLLLSLNLVGVSASRFEERQQEQTSEKLQFFVVGSADQQVASRPVGTVAKTSEVNPFSTFQSWIRQLKETNKDVTGWLKVPGTNINQPIVQTKEYDNNYYNDRDWKGVQYPGRDYRNYAVTSSFLDVRAVMGESWRSTSRNTVIYGHNWTNLRKPYNIGESYTQHVMFGQLPSYTDINFARQNPYIYYSTDKMEGIWKVFAVAACEVDNYFLYNNPNPSEENFKALIQDWKERSVLNFDVPVDERDRLLTLSTCTREYNVGDVQRFVVVARLLRPEESEKDAVTVALNPSPKQPVFNRK